MQLVCLLFSVVFFFLAEMQSLQVGFYLFLLGIVLSRVGLWGYDLVEVQLMQILVEPHQRGLINGTEYSLTQLAWLLILGLGLILYHPSQFGWLVIISINICALASLVYVFWWWYKLKGRNALEPLEQVA
jgi:iron-regulated transporter 1